MKKELRHLKKNKGLILIAAPTLLLTLVLKYLPLAGVYLAFVNFVPGKHYFQRLFTSKFVGLDNFKFMFYSKDIWMMLRNTIGYNLIFIIVGLVTSVTVAIMINEITFKKTKKVIHTIMFLPYFMSWVAVSFMVYGFLAKNGLINTFLISHGFDTINFYENPKYWPFILVLLSVWKGIGYGSVIYLSALTGINRSLYEAAMIDGANKWQQIKHITIPSLKPMMIVLTILAIGKIMFSDFGLFYQIPKQSSFLYSVTQTLDIYVYNTFKVSNNASMSAAAGLFQSVIGCIMIIGVNKIVKKIDKEQGMF